MARAALWIWSCLACIFLVVPMLTVIPLSFSVSEFLQFPPPGYTIRWYERFFADSTWTDALWRSVKVAAIAVFIATTTGTATAYALTAKVPRFRAIVEPFFVVPMVVPAIVFAIGAYLASVSLGLVGSLWLLAAAHAVLGVPFVILTVLAGLRTVSDDLMLAASSLGASPFAAFRLVAFPLIAPSILVSAVIVTVVSLDETVVALFLSPDIAPTFPVRMYSSIRVELDPLLPVAATLVIVATVCLGLALLLIRTYLWRRYRPAVGHTIAAPSAVI